MRNNTRQSLIRALSFCSLRELPEADNGEDVWIKAIALVEKSTGEECFVSLTKDYHTLENKVTRDFGATGAIVRYISVHPYLYLSSDFMPKFNDKSKDSRVAYLRGFNSSIDWNKKTLKELNNIIIGFAIMMQLDNIAANEKYIEDDRQEIVDTEVRGHEDEIEVDM